MKSKRRRAAILACCAVMALPITGWTMSNTQCAVFAADYNSPIPIAVGTENDYFEVVDNIITSKKAGYYLSVYTLTGYYQTSVGCELIEDTSLDNLISTCLSERADDFYIEAGTPLNSVYGDDNYLLIYSADGINFEVCYKIDLLEQPTVDSPTYNLFMRYRFNEAASAAEDNLIAQYDCQFKIDTTQYDSNYDNWVNTVVNPPSDVSSSAVLGMPATEVVRDEDVRLQTDSDDLI